MGSYLVRELATSARSAAAMAAATVTLLFAAGCTHAQPTGADAARSVRVAFCGGAARAQPDVVAVNCLNDSITARQLEWSNWGGPVATATGSAVVDLCAYEDCAEGDYVRVPIVLITSKIVRCQGKARAYSRLQYLFVGRSPFAGLQASISVPDGSNSPANPANQTVRLAC